MRLAYFSFITLSIFVLSCSSTEKENSVISPKKNNNSVKNDSLVEEELNWEHRSEDEDFIDRKFIEGTLILASEDTGLPYTHNFSILLENGDSLRFNFFGGKYSSKFISYLGLKCKVEYKIQKSNYPIQIIIKNENGEFVTTENNPNHSDYLKYNSFIGIYNAPYESGDLPSEFTICNNKDTLNLIDFITSDDQKKNGSEVKVYYDERNENIAMLVKFPTIHQKKSLDILSSKDWIKSENCSLPLTSMEVGKEGKQKHKFCRSKFANGLHIGKIVDCKCSFGYAGVEIIENNFDILLTNSDYAWAHVNECTLDAKIVLGGFEPDRFLGICKGEYRNEVFPGKIVDCGCNITYGKYEVTLSEFDALVYKNSIN